LSEVQQDPPDAQGCESTGGAAMIVTTMRLHSAISRDRDQDLVRITIINTGTGSEKRGNYSWKIYGRRNQLLRSGSILDWPRKSKTALALLQRVINDAYPRGIKRY